MTCDRCNRDVYPLHLIPDPIGGLYIALRNSDWVCDLCLTKDEKWEIESDKNQKAFHHALEQARKKKREQRVVTVDEVKWAQKVIDEFECPNGWWFLDDCDGHQCLRKDEADPQSEDYYEDCWRARCARGLLHAITIGKVQVYASNENVEASL